MSISQEAFDGLLALCRDDPTAGIYVVTGNEPGANKHDKASLRERFRLVERRVERTVEHANRQNAIERERIRAFIDSTRSISDHQYGTLVIRHDELRSKVNWLAFALLCTQAAVAVWALT